jgi:hypothetical protein
MSKNIRREACLDEDYVAIELKVVKSANIFDSLFGQVARYKDQFRKIIVVFIDEFRNPGIMKREIARLEELDPEKIKVIQK